MTRRFHLMPWLFLALCAITLTVLILASAHLASADCIIGPGVVCPPDDPSPVSVYIPVAIWR